MNDDKADTRCKIGLNEWLQHPAPHTLKIADGDPSYE